MRLAFVTLVATFVMGLTIPRTARAEGPFDGKWKQGPLHEEFIVQQWLPGCGPAPVTQTLGGDDPIVVRSEGDELSFAGGGRTFRTNQCYDAVPTLVRDTHSRDPSGRSWRTRCVTPPSDPRRVTMNTLVAATTDSHIDVIETGRYEILLAEGRCIADVKRSRGFDLVARDGAPAPASVAAPAAPQPAAAAPVTRASLCASPGDPARLEVRPSRKLIRTGESFAFRAVVLDANRCPVVGAGPVSWNVASGTTTTLTVDSSGRVTAPPDAPEGSAQIVVAAAGRTTRVTVDVASPEHYADLLAKSGLNASGENDAASVAETATGSIGGGDARAEDSAKARRGWFIAIVATMAALLGGVALFFVRRSKHAEALEKKAEEAYEERVREVEQRRAEKRAKYEAQKRAHEDSLRRAKEDADRAKAKREADRRVGNDATILAATTAPATVPAPPPAGMLGMICPTCRREYPRTSVFCPQDATKLVPMNAGQPLATQPSAGAGSICPACKRGYAAGLRNCPQDGEELVPYAMHVAVPKPGTGTIAMVGKGKICPTCGGRFDGNAAFCGKDGTALVLIN